MTARQLPPPRADLPCLPCAQGDCHMCAWRACPCTAGRHISRPTRQQAEQREEGR